MTVGSLFAVPRAENVALQVQFRSTANARRLHRVLRATVRSPWIVLNPFIWVCPGLFYLVIPAAVIAFAVIAFVLYRRHKRALTHTSGKVQTRSDNRVSSVPHSHLRSVRLLFLMSSWLLARPAPKRSELSCASSASRSAAAREYSTQRTVVVSSSSRHRSSSGIVISVKIFCAIQRCGFVRRLFASQSSMISCGKLVILFNSCCAASRGTCI